ncbi:MAG: hypothetical protein QM756_19280 [Polyangiaceae bacterium]
MRLALLLWLPLVTGCASHYVTRGADLYAGGHFIEAAEVFERTEARLPQASRAEQARYGLYRGATLLALGDALRAGRWLGYSLEIVRGDPGALSDEEGTMLRRALTLASAPRTTRPAAPSEAAAVAGRSPAVPAGEVGN